jgi:outer membrane protein assembly factor BamA
VRTSLGISYQNLGGWHRGISARAILNRRLENYRFIEYNTSIGFREPYFVGWPVTLSTSVNFIRREYSSFDAKISKFIASFSRNFSSSFTGFIEYSFERLTIDNIRNVLYSTESDAGTKDIGAITPGFIFDTRDNKFNPSSGIISSNRFELASSSLGSRDKRGELGYYRLVTSNSFYRPLLGDVVFAGAVNLGFERSNVFGQPIPLTKLFRLGGLSSIRGYRDDIIEVETQSVINGTLALVNYRGELRIPLSGSVGTAFFVDAGNLNIDNFQPFTLLRASAGMGLRYTTPVGPVVLDVAWKLQRKPSNLTTRDTDRYRIHFAIGTF